MIHTMLFGFSSLSLLVVSGALYRLSPLSNALILTFALFGLSVLVLSQRDEDAPLAKYFLPLVASALLLLFLKSQLQTKPVVAQAYVLVALALLLATPVSRPKHKNIRLAVLLSLATFFVVDLALAVSSTAWFVTEGYARHVSFLLGSLFHLPLRLGPTAMGLSGLVLCIFYVWARIILTPGRPWKRGVATTLVLISVNHFGALFFAWLASLLTSRRATDMSWNIVLERGCTALDFVPVLFLLQCLVIYALLDRSVWAEEVDTPSPPLDGRWPILVSGVLSFLLVLAASLLPQWPAGEYKGRVVLYQGGITSWEKPNFKELGAANRSGLFCVLPDYLQTFGFHVELTRQISPPALREADVFAVMNFNDEWDEESHGLLNSYVKQGGTLMVFADHTDMSGLMGRTNALLSETPLRINFDSAHFLDDYWNNAFVARLHPSNRVNWDNHGAGVSVGASLRLLSSKAIPMLIARHGFSDKGNRNNALYENYLGDRIYSVEEPLGDIVLAAECDVGKGKVIVFGDTALLQMGALPYCHRYVADLFRWAVHGRTQPVPWGGFLVLAVMAVWWLLLRRSLSLLLLFTMTVSAAAAVVVGDWNLKLWYGAHEYSGPLAYLDHAHVSLCDHEGYSKDDGDTYFVDNLVRNGYLPMAWKRPHRRALEKSLLMTSMAATKPYARDEILLLNAFMEGGGQVMILSSDRCSHAARDILRFHGMEILSTPLGAVDPENNSQKVLMYNVNPLSVEDLSDEEIRCTAFETYPVVVERKIGQGKMTVVADYGLFFNGRLEKKDWASRANVEFLKGLVGKDQEKGRPSSNGTAEIPKN